MPILITPTIDITYVHPMCGFANQQVAVSSTDTNLARTSGSATQLWHIELNLDTKKS